MFFVRLNAPLIDLIVNIVLLIWCPSFQDSDKRKSGAAGGSGSSSDAKKKRSDDDRPKGFDRGLDPERIIGATDSSGTLICLFHKYPEQTSL